MTQETKTRAKRSDALPPEVRAQNRKDACVRYRANHPDRHRESQAKYRAENKDKIAELQRVHNARGAQRYLAAKDKPCADCGGKFHYAAMDFDHTHGKREVHRSVSMRRLSIDDPAKFDEEVAKCDVVCSNCHRVRTWARLCGDHRIDENKF